MMLRGEGMSDLILFIIFIFVFLAGMSILRMGLFNLSGESLKTLLLKVTDKPWKSFLAGIGFTGILQSSSAVMVMTVGFVSAGSLAFPQTIGIILGTNIGSTFITEFMSFSLDQIIIPCIILGCFLTLIPRFIIRSLGLSLIGLSVIFVAMKGFKFLSGPIAHYPITQNLMGQMEEHLLIALLVGLILTALIHSSSVIIGMAMGFIASGELSVTSAIIVMLGSNIGTCITGYMASIGSGYEAKLTAYAHIWLNILGVLLFLPFVKQLEGLAAFFTSNSETQLAHASVLFNVITSLLVLPITRPFANLISSIHRKPAR